MQYSRYVIQIDKEHEIFLFNTKNNISLKVEKSFLSKIEVDEVAREQFTLFLSTKNFFSEENELQKMIDLFKNRDKATLRIIILAHGDCNFRCKYCYEKFSNCLITSQKSGIIAFVTKKLEEGHFEDLHVSWFGGEPLLGYRDILEISKELISLSEKQGVRYHSDMTTNGYLLNHVTLSRLVSECRVGFYQITIDGSRGGHDSQRILKNGRGTYERILSNLRKAQASDLQFSMLIRLNVSKENYLYVDSFLEGDAQQFKRDRRFHLIFRNVGDWGCGDRIEGYEVKRFDRDVSFALSSKAIAMGFRLFDDEAFKSNYYACYAQKPNSYTIDTSGNLLKCTVALYNQENKIGDLQLAEIDEANHNLWLNHYNFLPKCQDCQLLLICKGGACPKQDIFNERDFEEKCYRMTRNIMNNFELAILSNKINYVVRSD